MPNQEKEPWYYSGLFVVAALVLCFPVGVVLMWVAGKWTPKTRLILTALAVGVVVIGNMRDSGGRATPPPPLPQKAVEQPPEPPDPPERTADDGDPVPAKEATAAPVAVSKPAAWQMLPEGTLTEMEDRLEELKRIHKEATGLSRVEKTRGLAVAGRAMRQLQAKCRDASDDYDLRFGQFSPHPDFNTSSRAGEAHLAMRGAIAHVCGSCPTLTPDAPNACKRATAPVSDAGEALRAWRAVLIK